MAGVDSINNNKIVMPSSQFVTSTHNAYALLSVDDYVDDNLNSPVSILKHKDKFFNNCIASKEGVGSSNAFASKANVNYTGWVLNNNNVTTGHTVKTIRSNNSTSTDAVQHNKGNESDDKDDTVFHPPDKNINTIDPSKDGVTKIEHTDVVKSNNPSKKGVDETDQACTVRSNKAGSARDDGINPFKEGVQAINNNHLKEGVGKIAVRFLSLIHI